MHDVNQVKFYRLEPLTIEVETVQCAWKENLQLCTTQTVRSHWPRELLLQLARVWREELDCQSEQGVCRSWNTTLTKNTKQTWADDQATADTATSELIFKLAYFGLVWRWALWVPARPETQKNTISYQTPSNKLRRYRYVPNMQKVWQSIAS